MNSVLRMAGSWAAWAPKRKLNISKSEDRRMGETSNIEPPTPNIQWGEGGGEGRELRIEDGKQGAPGGVGLDAGVVGMKAIKAKLVYCPSSPRSSPPGEGETVAADSRVERMTVVAWFVLSVFISVHPW